MTVVHTTTLSHLLRSLWERFWREEMMTFEAKIIDLQAQFVSNRSSIFRNWTFSC